MFEEYLNSIIDNKELRKKILNTPVSEELQAKQNIMIDLDKKIKNYLFASKEGFELLERYKSSDLLDKINEQAYLLIRQDLDVKYN